MIQGELLPWLGEELGGLTPKLEKLIHTLEWSRIEEFVPRWCGIGRPPVDREAMANAFVAKAVLNLPTTVALIERLQVDRALRRICGFRLLRRLPDEATFSRAFAEFAESRLAERVHEALVRSHLGGEVVGHVSRDATAIEARERPAKREEPAAVLPSPQQALPGLERSEPRPVEEAPPPKKRGRPRKGEARPPATRIERQRTQTLPEMLAELPRGCDRGSKCNAQGYKNSWNGYKLHLDTADCSLPIGAILTSASVHDSQVAIPLSRLSAQRVTSLYDVMDAAYCSEALREESRALGHIPLIDHNPRRGEKIEFDPATAQRYHERTVAERMNARLKDEFGGRNLRVRGPVKVMSHLCFGLLALTVDQLMRLLQ